MNKPSRLTESMSTELIELKISLREMLSLELASKLGAKFTLVTYDTYVHLHVWIPNSMSARNEYKIEKALDMNSYDLHESEDIDQEANIDATGYRSCFYRVWL